MEKEEIHIGKLIRHQLKEDRRSAAWLAEQLHCDRSNIYKLYQKQNIDAAQLLQISIALQFDLFAYYSEYLKMKCGNIGYIL